MTPVEDPTPMSPGPVQRTGAVALAIARPVTVTVAVLLVWMFGALSVSALPIQLIPDLETPTLTVQTDWPGAAPVEIERDIVSPQEEELKSVQGMVRMESTSQQDRGEITLEFAVGTDIDEALVRVSNKLQQVQDLPSNAEQPVINTADSAGPPLAVLSLKQRDGRSSGAWKTWTEDNILPMLERVPGVAGVRFFGGRSDEVRVRFDPRGLAARGISVQELAAAVQRDLRDVSAGDLDLGKRRFVVRTRLMPPSPDALGQAVVRSGPDGQPIRVADVATVEVALGKQTAFVRQDSQETLVFLMDREAGSNVLETTQAIRATVEEVQATLLTPRDLELVVLSDQVGYITAALDLVRDNLVTGALLAVLVLWAFLRSLRVAGLVALAIPTCVMGTVIGMRLMGLSVNVISLAGMAFAVGMVVDNAIVVLEAIVAERQLGRDGPDAAFVGGQTVWGAIVAGTGTTIAVFAPILAWQGEVGQLLRDISAAIALSVVLSLAVSVLAIPAFAARLPADSGRAKAEGMGARWGQRAREVVLAAVRAVVIVPWRAAVVAVGTVAVASVLAVGLVPPMEYLPTGQREIAFGAIVPPPGYSVDEMRQVGDHILGRLTEHLGEEHDGKPAVGRTFFVGRPGSGFMGATAVDPMRTAEVAAYVRSIQAEVPGILGFAFQAALFGRSLGGGRAIEVDVLGSDLDEIRTGAGALFGALRAGIPGAQVRPMPSLDAGGPELRVTPHRAVVSQNGVDGVTLGRAVDAFVDGWRIGELGEDGESRLDVQVVADPPATDLRTLAAMPLATPSGRVLPLGALASLEETLSPLQIRRLERRRGITLEVSPPEDVALESALDVIQNQVVPSMRAQGALPASLQIRVGGAADDLGDAQQRMLGVLGLALVISYLLMSALFEDFLAPVAILSVLPMAAVGGLVGLSTVDALLAPTPLDMLTALGFVILIGVVVNNPILVVDGALARLREGVPLVEAIVGGVGDRVRPILMTTLTTLAGLTPLVLAPGQGSELYRGIGAVVLGGLVVATALTLVVVPAVFSLLWRARGVR